MLRSLYTLEEQTEDEMLKAAIVGAARRRRGRQLGRRGDGVPARRLRSALPLDGPRRRGRGSARGGARPGRRTSSRSSTRCRRQVKSAMMYPAVVFSLALVVMVVVVAFIVPVFVGIFEEISAENPGAPTRAAADDPDRRRRSRDFDHRPVVHPAAGDRGRRLRLPPLEEDREGAACSGTRSSCGFPFHIGDIVQKVALARWSRTLRRHGLVRRADPPGDPDLRCRRRATR